MLEFLQRYQRTMRHEHGWETPLRCPVCDAVAVPNFNGWTPSSAIRLGNQGTIFASLTCRKCGAPLKDAAGHQLVELFSDVPLPDSNRRLLKWFVALTAGLILIAATALLASVIAGWRFGGVLLAAFIVPLGLLRPLGAWLNYAVVRHLNRCDCGSPLYKFMGLLGRSCCYRCSFCGRLLRLRN